MKTEQKFQPLTILSLLHVSGKKLWQTKPSISLTLPSRWWMMAALKICLWWEVDYFYFGILVVTHDAWLKRNSFTVCVFSASFTCWLSTELCPEMSPEPLSGSHGPSVEAPTSAVVGKRGYGNWCTGLWRYCIALGSLISKWLSKLWSKTRERT